MTPNSTLTHEHAREVTPVGPGLRMPQYPRIAEVLRQMRPEAGGGLPPTTPDSDSPVARDIAAATIASTVTSDQLVIAPPVPALAASMTETLSVVAAPEQLATVLDRDEAELTEAELDELIAELGMRDIAREALRARMVSAAINARQRSTYELVFLMLAFSVMVLVSVPSLVQLALALRGTVPA